MEETRFSCLTFFKCMTIKEIARATGLSRQWINELADRGEIPSIKRKLNGRLAIEDTPALRKWIDGKKKSVQRDRDRRACIHHRALASVSKKLTRVVNEPNRRVDASKVRAFQEKQILLKTMASRDHYTTGELAKEVSFDRRHIARIAATIPGSSFDKGKWKFKKSAQLYGWIQITGNANRQRNRRHNHSVTLTTESRRFYEALRSCRPIDEWTRGQCRTFLSDFQPISAIAHRIYERSKKA